VQITSAQIGQITNLNTVERMAAWSGLALARANPNLKVLELENFTQRAAQATVIQSEGEGVRLVIRINLPLNPNYATENPGKLWLNAQELSVIAIPTGFLT